MDLVKKLNPFKKHRIPNAFQTNQLSNHVNNNNTNNHANNRNNQISNNETHSKKKAATEKELVNLNHKIEKLLADLNDNQNEKNFSVEEECVVCLTSRATMKTYPCGHRVVCRKCFVKTIQTAVSERCLPLKCVVCRTKILKLKQVDHKHENGKKYKRNHRMQQQMQMEQNYTSDHFKRSVYSLPAPYQATALASRRQQAKEQLSNHYLSDCHFNSTAPYTSQARELNGSSHNNSYENHLNQTETKNTQTNIEITTNGILPRNNNFDYSTVNNVEHKNNSIPTSYANRLGNIPYDNYPGKNYHFYNEKTNTSENKTVFNGIESYQKYDQDDNIGHLNNGYQSSSSTSIGSLQPSSQNNPYKQIKPHTNKQLQQEMQKTKNRKFETKKAFVQTDKTSKDSIIKIPPPPETNKRRIYQKRSLSTSNTKPKKYNYTTAHFAFTNGTSSNIPHNVTPVKPSVCASNLNSYYGNQMQVSLLNNNNNNQTDLINNNVSFDSDMNIYKKSSSETSNFLNDVNEQNKTSISNINLEVLNKNNNKHVYEKINDNTPLNPVMITDSNNNNILEKNHAAISSSHKPHQGSYTINLSNFTFTSNNTSQNNNKCNICRQQKLLLNSKSNTCTHNTAETKTYKHSQLVYPCDRPIPHLEGWTDKVERSAPQQMSFLKVFSKKSKAVSSLFAVD